jgi:signal transduction histidine kinase
MTLPGRKRIDFHWSGPDGPIPGDRDRLQRVLINLLDNALKYTPESGVVEINTAVVNGAIEISVRDHGPGIQEPDIHKIFDKFYRARDGISEKTHGSGLGLTIARGIVEAHGGRIWAESQFGEGATFRFVLPAGRAKHQAQGA